MALSSADLLAANPTLTPPTPSPVPGAAPAPDGASRGGLRGALKNVFAKKTQAEPTAGELPPVPEPRDKSRHKFRRSEIAPDPTVEKNATINQDAETEVLQTGVVIKHYEAMRVVRDRIMAGALPAASLDMFNANFLSDFDQRVTDRLAEGKKTFTTASRDEKDAAIAGIALDFVTEHAQNVEYAHTLVEQQEIALQAATNAHVYGPDSGLFDELSRPEHISPVTRLPGGSRTRLSRNVGGAGLRIRGRIPRHAIGSNVVDPLPGVRQTLEDMGLTPIADKLIVQRYADAGNVTEFHADRRKKFAERHHNTEFPLQVDFGTNRVTFAGLTPVQQAIAEAYQLSDGLNIVTGTVAGPTKPDGSSGEPISIKEVLDAQLKRMVAARADFYNEVGMARIDFVPDLNDLTHRAQVPQTLAEQRAARMTPGGTVEQRLEAKKDIIQQNAEQRTAERLHDAATHRDETKLTETVDKMILQLENRAALVTDEAELAQIEDKLKQLRDQRADAEAKETKVGEKKTKEQERHEAEIPLSVTIPSTGRTVLAEYRDYKVRLIAARAAKNAAQKELDKYAGYAAAIDAVNNDPSKTTTRAQKDASIGDIIHSANTAWGINYRTKDAELRGIVSEKSLEMEMPPELVPYEAQLQRLDAIENDIATIDSRISFYTSPPAGSGRTPVTETVAQIDVKIKGEENRRDALEKPDEYQQRQLESYQIYRDELLDPAKNAEIQHRADLADRDIRNGTDLLKFDYLVDVYDGYPPVCLRTWQIVFGEDILLANREGFERATTLLTPERIYDALGIPRNANGEIDDANFQAMPIDVVDSDVINEIKTSLRESAINGTLGKTPQEVQDRFARIDSLPPDATTGVPSPVEISRLDRQLYHYESVSDLASQILQSWDEAAATGTPPIIIDHFADDAKVRDANQYAHILDSRRMRMINQTIGAKKAAVAAEQQVAEAQAA